MSELGRILIADDEETFLYSTAALLRREGYECACAPDAATAAAMLRENIYDLLIADIKMPGNPNLELIHELPHIAEGLPVILVTGYPSLQSAIQSIQLSVVAYLIKPPDFGELRAAVQSAIERSRAYRAIRNTQQRLQDWYGDLESLAQLMRTRSGDASVRVNAFTTLTLRNLGSCLADLRHLRQVSAMHSAEPDGRPPHNSPQQAALTTDLPDSDPDARASQLERALYRITSALEEAGILTHPYASLPQPDVPKELRDLSSREREVLHSLLAGQRVPTIARSFYLSPHTVRNHLKSIFRKLGVRSQIELLERLRGQSRGR
jgi:DNA-binding NarL/FixJ family response regulator